MSSPKVFSTISSLPRLHFTEAAYQLLLLLRYRNTLDSDGVKQFLKVANLPGTPKHDVFRKNLKSSVGKIEKAEGKELCKIPDKDVLRYVKLLDSLISARSTSHVYNAASVGSALLFDLRKDSLNVHESLAADGCVGTTQNAVTNHLNVGSKRVGAKSSPKRRSSSLVIAGKKRSLDQAKVKRSSQSDDVLQAF
jgi:hypothetical protein